MNRILNKRLLRELKHNFFRYAALFLLVLLGMYMVVSMVAAADIVIEGTEKAAGVAHTEDGSFTTFIPLTNGQMEQLTKDGTEIEAMFSFDVKGENDTSIRVMKNRKQINLLQVEEGENPTGDNDLVLEKRYAEENNLHIGDAVHLADQEFIICGIGTTPDYDQPLNKLSDASADSKQFGTAFVTDSAYEKIKAEGEQKTEEYLYAFRLSGAMSAQELKENIRSFTFDYTEVEDPYFQDYIKTKLEKKDAFQEGMNDLLNGAEKLKDGLGVLNENGEQVASGTSTIVQSYFSQVNTMLSGMGISEPLTRENYEAVLGTYAQLTQNEKLNEIKNNLSSIQEFETKINAYTNGVAEASDGSATLWDGIHEWKEETDTFIEEYLETDLDNLMSFVEAKDNPRIKGAAQDIEMNKSVGLLAGVVVMMLFAYVISVFVMHQIQNESSVIGTLYAMGATKKDLFLHYITLPVWITFAGGIIGTLLGFSRLGITYQLESSYAYYSIPEFDKLYPVYLIIYGVVMPPVVAVVVNYITINKKLSRTALSLIKNEQKETRTRNIQLGKLGFIRTFQVRQMLREARCGMTVIVGMLISLLVFMIGLDCYACCRYIKEQNVKDTAYTYMYHYKYPEQEVPAGGEACYMESLSKTDLGFTLDVTIIGIDEDNPYFAAKPSKGQNKLVIGSGVAKKYNLKKGDAIVLSDAANERDYAFQVEDVVDYSIGLTTFMDLDSMRTLFDQEETYYNMVLSENSLAIEEGRLYSVTTKQDVEHASQIFMDKMGGLIVALMAVSIVIFCVVMFLMMNVMMERASFGISLVKIFGFRTSEIRKLYLNGNFVIVLLGAVIGIPLAKYIIDLIYPNLIANITCGTYLEFPPVYYGAVFAGILAVYVAISGILTVKLNRVTPAEVLKNRE